MSQKKISKKFLDMCDMYKLFAGDKLNLDFSEESMREMYEAETFGTIKINISGGGYLNGKLINGFAVGKKYMNVTIKMWKESIANGLLSIHELYEDETLPHWFLDKVLKQKGSKNES